MANWVISIACNQPTLNSSRCSLSNSGRVAEIVKGKVRSTSAAQRALNALMELPNISEINPAAKLIAQSRAAKAMQLHTIRGNELDRLDACQAANAASVARAQSVRVMRLRVDNQLWGRGTSFRAARTRPASTMLRDALKALADYTWGERHPAIVSYSPSLFISWTRWDHRRHRASSPSSGAAASIFGIAAIPCSLPVSAPPRFSGEIAILAGHRKLQTPPQIPASITAIRMPVRR